MAVFHETRMGAKFFESDVPRLVDAVQSIAKSLTALLTALAQAEIDRMKEKR